MEKAIEIDGLAKSFRQGWRRRQIEAVKPLSMAVEVGEAFGFVGQNGAGKSTTIKMLTGALLADSGNARLFGVDIGDPHSRRGLGYVPENPSLYDYLTPLEILEMGVRMHGRRHGASAIRAHCLHWLERFGIAHVANKRIRGFSKGMAQRTALAHALCLEPKLLILDEPLSGLDPLGRREVIDIVAEFRYQGGTVFFSSHVLYDVERLADRFGLIHRGELRTIQSPAELLGERQEMLLISHGDAALEGMTPLGRGRWQCVLPQSLIWQRMQELRVAGHEVVELRSNTNLEQAFMHWVQQESAV